MPTEDSPNTTPPPAANAETPTMIPYARLAEVVAERDKFKKELTAALAKAGEVETHSKRAADLEAELNKTKSGYEADFALIEVGLGEADAREYAKLLYGKLPEEKRPSVADWAKGWKEDPTTAPKLLQGFFGQKPAVSAPTEKPAEAQKATGLPSSTTGVQAGGAQTASRETLPPGKLLEAAKKAAQTGDWSEVDRLREIAGIPGMKKV